MPLRRRGEMEL